MATTEHIPAFICPDCGRTWGNRSRHMERCVTLRCNDCQEAREPIVGD